MIDHLLDVQQRRRGNPGPIEDAKPFLGRFLLDHPLDLTGKGERELDRFLGGRIVTLVEPNVRYAKAVRRSLPERLAQAAQSDYLVRRLVRAVVDKRAEWRRTSLTIYGVYLSVREPGLPEQGQLVLNKVKRGRGRVFDLGQRQALDGQGIRE